MFIVEVVVLLLSSITGIYASYLVFKQARNSPLYETTLLAVGLLFFGIAFFLYIPLTLLYSPSNGIQKVDKLTTAIFQGGAATATFGLFLSFLAAYLPTFQLSYRKLMVLITVIAIFMTSITLSYDITITIVNTRILITYPPLTASFISITQATLAIMIIYRVSSVSKLTGESFIQSNLSMLLLFFLGIAASVSISIPVIFPDSIFPTFTNAILVALLFLYFANKFRENDAFFFITSARLEAVLIADRNSGVSLYSKNFNVELPIEHLLTSIFTGINLSLTMMLQSDEDINQIIFGDKVVQINRKESISVFIITTSVNLISTQILKYITEMFYQKYSEIQIKEGPKIFAEIPFDQEITWVKRYMPH